MRKVFWSLSKCGAISGVDRELRRLQLYDGLEKKWTETLVADLTFAWRDLG
jgi:hypothetical protein